MDGSTGVSPRPASTFTVALWHPAGTPPPPKLVGELARRGITVRPVTSPFMALATLCREARRSAGAQVALVLASPEALPDAAAVYDAAMQYAPSARVWLYGPEANPTLRAVIDSDVDRWRGGSEPGQRAESAPAVVVHPGAMPRPAPRPVAQANAGYRTKQPAQASLRLSGAGPMDPGRKPADLGGDELAGQEEPARPSQLLTPEELRMLLGEDDPGRP
jgi:hypothetical protein